MQKWLSKCLTWFRLVERYRVRPSRAFKLEIKHGYDKALKDLFRSVRIISVIQISRL